jgi:type IV fimbrial biogenesis protein FimT
MDTSMHRAKGFTLLELLMVILIVGILASVGTASFKYVTTSNRIASEINGLLGDMQFARSQAIKTGTTVSVCPSANPTSTTPTCTNTTTWTTGWVVFLDFNGNGAFDSATDQVIRYQNAISPDTLVSSVGTFKYITFNREGYASLSGVTGYTSIVLNSNPVNVQWRRCLAVSAIGALVVEKSGATVPTTC